MVGGVGNKLVQSVEHITLALKVLSSSPTLGVEITWKKKKVIRKGKYIYSTILHVLKKKSIYKRTYLHGSNLFKDQLQAETFGHQRVVNTYSLHFLSNWDG